MNDQTVRKNVWVHTKSFVQGRLLLSDIKRFINFSAVDVRARHNHIRRSGLHAVRSGHLVLRD